MVTRNTDKWCDIYEFSLKKYDILKLQKLLNKMLGNGIQVQSGETTVG